MNTSTTQALQISLRSRDSLTVPVSSLSVPPTPYQSVVDKIVKFTSKRRYVSSAEAAVTKSLAGPFNPGGVLILLQNPRYNHPWSQGVDAVISECPSLELLLQAIDIVSDKKLSLKDDISVLDRWAMHSKAVQLDELDHLVHCAIVAKQPDVILCMGTPAKDFVTTIQNRNPILNSSGDITSVVYSRHPSFCANYQRQNCHFERRNILRDVQIALDFVKSKAVRLPLRAPSNSRTWRYGIDAWSSDCFAGKRMVESADIEAVVSFLELLLELCFPDMYELPMSCIRVELKEPGSYFAFSASQKKILEYLEATPHSKKTTRSMLAQVLVKLNCAFRRASYFLPTYEVDWHQIQATIADESLDLEDLCQKASGCGDAVSADEFSIASLFDELPFAGLEDERSRTIRRLERLTWRVRGFLGERQAESWKSKLVFLSVGGERYRFTESSNMSHGKAAYKTEHNCNHCMERGDPIPVRDRR